MIIAIIRVAIVSAATHNIDLSWLYFWSVIEMATGKHTYPVLARFIEIDDTMTAISISCLASFRQLFVKSHDRQQPKTPRDGGSCRSLLTCFRSDRTRSHCSNPMVKWPTSRNKYQKSTERWDSQNNLVPLKTLRLSERQSFLQV